MEEKMNTNNANGTNDSVDRLEWRDSEKEHQCVSDKSPLSAGISPSSFYSQPTTKVKIHISSNPKSRDRIASSSRTSGCSSTAVVNLPSTRTLSNLLSEASLRVRQNQFKEILDREKLLRAAFKDVLSPANRNIKLFGLQTDAFTDFDVRLVEHLQYHKVNESDSGSSAKSSSDLALKIVRAAALKSDNNVTLNFEQGKEEQEILEEASSISSIDEPKRQRAHYASTSVEAEVNTQTQQLTQVSPGSSLQRDVYKAEFVQEKKLGILDMSELNLLLPPQWSMEPRIFSKELSSNGKRKYVVSSYGRFVDYYWRKILPTGRHYYELIRENTPCRLYLDLEFSKESNPELAASNILSEQLVSELINEICSEFQTAFVNLFEECALDRQNFVDLDSSTSSKFSRHIILHLPNQMLFANNAQVGFFVKNMVARLAEEIGTGLLQSRSPVLAKYLFLNKPSGKQDSAKDSNVNAKIVTDSTLHLNNDETISQSSSLTQLCEKSHEIPDHRIMQSIPVLDSGFVEKSTCFVDLGVYTKNRLFRLLGSSKYGKPPAAALRIADMNTFPFTNFNNEKFYSSEQKITISGSSTSNALFLNSSSEVNEEAETQRLRAAADWSGYAEALEKTLVVPLNWSRVKWPLLPTLELKEGGTIANNHLSKKKITASRYITSTGRSPFPCLDHYVKNVLGSRGGVEGDIRSWSISHWNGEDGADGQTNAAAKASLSSATSITYQISKNRWCERIGRHHKSNGIMWTVDLRKLYCFQTCYDAECRLSGFHGKPLDLPSELKLSIEDTLLDAALALLDEEELVARKERKELEEEEFERALLNLDISGLSVKNEQL